MAWDDVVKEGMELTDNVTQAMLQQGAEIHPKKLSKAYERFTQYRRAMELTGWRKVFRGTEGARD